MQKRNRKGFTLAELLIVVAIIAVLTAIAVPLFVSSVKKAQDATEEANKRAVRGAAVVYILGTDTPSDELTGPAGSTHDISGIYTLVEGPAPAKTKSRELVGPWYVVAKLDKSGNIKSIAINADNAQLAKDGWTADGAYTEAGGEITVCITVTELKSGSGITSGQGPTD